MSFYDVIVSNLPCVWYWHVRMHWDSSAARDILFHRNFLTNFCFLLFYLQQIAPFSFSAIIMLPRAQLEELLRAIPEVRDELGKFVNTNSKTVPKVRYFFSI